MGSLYDGLSLWVARFPFVASREGTQHVMSWDEFRVSLQGHAVAANKDAVPLWSPTRYRGAEAGSTVARKAIDVESITALALDVDDGTAPAKLWPALRPFEWIAHSSWGHSKAKPRYRIVLPLAEPVSAATWPAFRAVAVKLLADGASDPVCRDASRIYYYPSCPKGAESPWWRYNAGRLLSTVELAAEIEAWQAKQREAPRVQRNTIGWEDANQGPSPRQLLEMALGRGGIGMRNANATWLACQLRDNGYSLTTAESVCRDYANRAPQGDHSYTEEQAIRTVRSVFSNRRPDRVPWPAREVAPVIEKLRVQRQAPTVSPEPASSSQLVSVLAQVAQDFGAELEMVIDPRTGSFRATLTIQEGS